MIVENQSYNIDAVTGATISFHAIEKAVENALIKAGDTTGLNKKIDLRNVAKTNDKQDYRYLDTATLKFEDKADVLVIGSSAAGLSASIAARQKGVSVICL